MPRLQHFYGQHHLHCLTANIYRKARIFDSDRYKRKFVETLNGLRSELGFSIIGYVLIRQLTDSHLPIWPGPLANPSQIMQKLSERTAKFILRNLRENLAFPWCRKMLKRFALPPSVHGHAHYRVWNRRGYDMNIWSERKIREKLNYMHNNPVRRGLVARPADWPWSSWRFYYLGDSSVLAMDRLP
jgi:putative transposase